MENESMEKVYEKSMGNESMEIESMEKVYEN